MNKELCPLNGNPCIGSNCAWWAYKECAIVRIAVRI